MFKKKKSSLVSFSSAVTRKWVLSWKYFYMSSTSAVSWLGASTRLEGVDNIKLHRTYSEPHYTLPACSSVPPHWAQPMRSIRLVNNRRRLRVRAQRVKKRRHFCWVSEHDIGNNSATNKTDDSADVNPTTRQREGKVREDKGRRGLWRAFHPADKRSRSSECGGRPDPSPIQIR